MGKIPKLPERMTASEYNLMAERSMNEHQLQCHVIRWADTAIDYPKARLLFAVPNQGKYKDSGRTYMAAEGLRSGVPDLCLPVPSGGYGALFIEMKSATGKASENQKKWLADLNLAGNYAVVCNTATKAIQTIKDYLDGKLEETL